MAIYQSGILISMIFIITHFIIFFFFKISTFVGFAWSFVFSSPPQCPMTLDFEGFSIPDFTHYIYFPILILEKEPVFSLLNVEC